MEKQAAQELEKRRDEAFADRLIVTEQRVQLMERDVQRARKDAAVSVQVCPILTQSQHQIHLLLAAHPSFFIMPDCT